MDGSLNPPPPQREGDGFIDIFHIDVTEYKERLEKMGDLHAGAFNSMCIVRLPQVVPEQRALCSDTLWVTGHDLSVFAVIRNRLRKAILLGNPGIGKSWWQWQYLLYSMRPDVYRTLVDLFALHDAFTFKGDSPSVIIRFRAEAKSSCTQYYISIVSAQSLHDHERTVVLYEPGFKRDVSVSFEELVKMSMVATVSPDERRYKEFKKNGGVKVYLPCPSKGEILAIDDYIRKIEAGDGKETFRVSANDVLSRIDELGPFPRYVLTQDEDIFLSFSFDRLDAVDKLGNDAPWRPHLRSRSALRRSHRLSGAL